MRQNTYRFWMRGTLALLAMVLTLPTGAVAASKYKVLYRFTGEDGANPFGASLIFDAAGNLYGTTYNGGSGNRGTIFKLTPHANGTWTESVLHSFGGGADGAGPFGGLVLDAAGNLYGATELVDTVFKLTRNSDGTWTESVLYGFVYYDEVGGPLVFDAAGNLYGATAQGGASTNCPAGCGSVFKLMPNSDGTWTESVLHSFAVTDGSAPLYGHIFDAAGNLYGMTVFGDNVSCGGGCGTVFKLMPNSDGTWTESVLYGFTGGKDGEHPSGSLIFDEAGNLYGTTASGGAFGQGVVFKLATTGKESVLHSFGGVPDGAIPNGSLVRDRAGNLYGTTGAGGCKGVNGGTVFKMTPNPNGTWAFSVLHVFGGSPAMNPTAGLVVDKAGNLYGTTFSCGSGQGCQGVVYEITP